VRMLVCLKVGNCKVSYLLYISCISCTFRVSCTFSNSCRFCICFTFHVISLRLRISSTFDVFLKDSYSWTFYCRFRILGQFMYYVCIILFHFSKLLR